LVLEQIDGEIESVQARTPDEVIDAATDADALIVDAGTPVTERVLNTVDTLEVIGRAGIGVDNINLKAAENNDMIVVNAPAYSIEEVSTHAHALLLACVRKLWLFDEQVKAGTWEWKEGQPMYRLSNQTLGLIAFGKIARRFAEKVSGYDIDLLAYDPYVSDDEMTLYDVEKVSFETLLAESDMISVHAPLTDETEYLIDADALDSLESGSIIINTSRGGIIDSDALYEALTDGTVAAAGLDVHEQEPLDESPLFDLQNVILTPHTAWYSEESRRELARSVTNDVVQVLWGKEPDSKVDQHSQLYDKSDRQ
jgi:D-3-phosphoglycerate dehydrogenase